MDLIPSRVDYTFEIAVRSTPTAASNTQKRRRLSKLQNLLQSGQVLGSNVGEME